MPSPHDESEIETRPNFPSTSRLEANPRVSHFPTDSRSSLIGGDDDAMSSGLPSHWPSNDSEKKVTSLRSRVSGLFLGWRIIILGSRLNFLLVLIPISWALSITMHDSHGLIFAFCILALVPLVKLHDLSTRELALRIGGSKTGLINASMSNIVGIVVAISALRKCELRVVQSSLIGSMLSRLLLVLGLCFFAGGVRFSEQGFDATATQVHSSLLSISVGAVILPAVYHFSLSGGAETIPELQTRNILRMSHGVSIILLFIYAAYLVFQLWSHSHLYSDTHNKKSKRHTIVLTPLRSKENTRDFTPGHRAGLSNASTDSFSPSHLLPPRQTPSSPLSVSFTPPNLPNGREDTLVGYPMARETSNISGYSSSSTRIGSDEDLIKERTTPTKEPRVSWFLTVLLLISVTIAASATADWLVESMDGISMTISKEWVALVLLPAVTAIAECMTAVNVSVKDQLSLSISVAVGSTITALFVIPFMITLAWSMGKPLSLLMDPFESLVLYISVQTMSYVVADGKSNWLEGVILICLYIIIAVSFWFYPGSNLPESLAVCTV